MSATATAAVVAQAWRRSARRPQCPICPTRRATTSEASIGYPVSRSITGSTAGDLILANDNGEFVPKHDDFQFLEIVRPKAQGSKLWNPPRHHVTERDEHEASFYAGL
jgi:hypothetical protein